MYVNYNQNRFIKSTRGSQVKRSQKSWRCFFALHLRTPITRNLNCSNKGCQIFLVQLSKTDKIQQIIINYTKWPHNMPNNRKIDQHLPFQDPPKFTQTGIFCLKICHLATLVQKAKSNNLSGKI
jgi:hypothetical protein